MICRDGEAREGVTDLERSARLWAPRTEPRRGIIHTVKVTCSFLTHYLAW